jgi:hypothetical protein
MSAHREPVPTNSRPPTSPSSSRHPRIWPRADESTPLAPATLEELHRALVLLGRLPARKRAEVAALAGARVLLARIEPVLARLELADHGPSGCS